MFCCLLACAFCLVTVALSMYIRFVRLCATLSSLRIPSKFALYVCSLYVVTDPFVTPFCYLWHCGVFLSGFFQLCVCVSFTGLEVWSVLGWKGGVISQEGPGGFFLSSVWEGMGVFMAGGVLAGLQRSCSGV